MLRFTANTRFTDLTPRMTVGIIIANEVFASFGLDCWLTSVDDSRHNPGSLHPRGDAIDLRTRFIPKEHRQALPALLKARLSPVFQVIDEGDHIHVEHQPPEAR